MPDQKHQLIDVFSGVGGLSLGATRAGFSLSGAIELDPLAISTHERNFPKSVHLLRDVANLSGQEVLEACNVKGGSLVGLVGGPPCQGFSYIGRRSVSDPRNSLLGHFFRLISEVTPAFFLAENVPGILLPQNKGIVDAAIEQLPKNYTMLPPVRITASDLGTPTSRTRIFFFGFDPRKCGTISQSDLESLRSKDDVRVGDALKEIPSIRSTWQSEKDSWRIVGSLGNSAFERRLKQHIPPSVGDPTAIDLFRRKRLVSGFLGTVHTEESIRRFRALRPGETDLVSRSMRLRRDGYCPTLRAGTGPDRGSYQAVRPIHPTSPRVITPREAARLQGFPDWFQFHPTKWHSFRQIGNSVSPIVAERLLKLVFERLELRPR